ncbi:MAG: hypothetical protein AUJ01_11155 [Acidobacteria bacterium 13_1_40CM_3_65_5]|nr:MAG: hypothetical protein AUJ01_11155 [Acidobacteria bacterium 13_1_40CM_3_65_5]
MRTSHLRGILLLSPFLFAAIVSDAHDTRVEQNDPSINYSGSWYSNSAAGHSGGQAALTNSRGARATLSFTGTGISWIGVKDGWSGLATVSLDGSMTVVDSYSGTAHYQDTLFTARGLSAGPHTLSIEVTHERGPGTEGSWVWIDAFDIENGSPIRGGITANTGRVEEDDPALLYTGHWYPNINPTHSGGRAIMATDAGARVTLRFNGTGIAWNAYRDGWSGVARVYLDGDEKATVDTYLSPAGRGVPYSFNGLEFGTHSLSIEVTGTRNESSKGSWIWLDSFDVTQ